MQISQMKGVLHGLNDQRVISISRANMERERVCMRQNITILGQKAGKHWTMGGVVGKYYCPSIPET